MEEKFDVYADDFNPPSFSEGMDDFFDRFFVARVIDRSKKRGDSLEKYVLENPRMGHIHNIKLFEELQYVARWVLREAGEDGDETDLIYELTSRGLEALEGGSSLNRESKKGYDGLTFIRKEGDKDY